MGRARTQSQSFVPGFSEVSAIVAPPSSSLSAVPITQVTHHQQQQQQQQQQQASVASVSAATSPQIVSQTTIPTVSVPATNPVLTVSTTEKRRILKGSSKKSKKNRSGHQISTKDLGRWKPIDDLALVIGIQQTNDLRMVHRGTKFSCKFTVAEMQSRWYSLLYEEPVSRIAVAAMRNLHPELVESVQSKALYTTQEEEILGTIKSVSYILFYVSDRLCCCFFRRKIQRQTHFKNY